MPLALRYKQAALSSRASGQEGFTLIEVMVAVFVLAIGVLGMAGMQAVGVRESQNTYFRTQADMLANDMADRMRANRATMIDSTPLDYVFDGTNPGTGPSCDAGTPCIGNLSAYDLSGWYNALQLSSLPSAIGKVTQVGASTTTYTVEVYWDENRDGNNDEVCSTTVGQDACIRLTVQF